MASADDFNNSLQDRLARGFSSQYRTIEPQPNVLDLYSSYTYNISLYFLPAADYRNMLSLQRPILPGRNLLLQSGGAPQGAENRNQWFPLDYYIDDISIQQLQPGRGTRGANGIVSLNFKITEPNGITFLDNLYYAVDQLLSSDVESNRKENYAAQIYLMHIKFFGYDQLGNLVQPSNPRDPSTVTDSRSVVEKFIPFRFVNITYRIANQLVEYDCQAVVPQNDIGTGQGRGVIPYNVELTASTLAEVFSGNALVNSSTQADTGGRVTTPAPGATNVAAPAKANTSGGPGTVVNGLVEALNNYQRELTLPQGPNGDTIYDQFDEFSVEFSDDDIIGRASTQPPGPTPKSQVSGSTPPTVGSRVLGSQQFVNNDSKKISAVAGTTLVQFLDQVVRNSSYIYDQQVQGYNADGELIQMTGRDVGLVAWYRIGVEAVPKAWDPKRNDYAYKITYRISPYIINDIRSPYFPETRFRGVHKEYNYWFTGLNTQILNYQQDFNYSYYMVMSGPQQPEQLANFREYEKRLYQPRSNESDQGQPNRVNEPAANLAERQYNAADLSRVSLSIVGDPAWIHQGEVWRGITNVKFTLNPFFSDGTINVEVEEPLFQISWNKPADYDLNTGVADPSARGFGGGNRLTTLSGGGTQTYVYRAISVTSSFSKGRFTQDIEGVLVTFPNFSIRRNLGEEVDSLFVETPEETERLLAEAERITRQNNTSTGETPATVLGTQGPGTGTRQGPGDRLVTGTRPSSIEPVNTVTGVAAAEEEPTIVPSRSPEPPTSGSETVTAPSQSSRANSQQSGIITPAATGFDFSLVTLRQLDPALGREFTEFRQQQENRIFEQQVARLTSQAEQNRSRPLSTVETNRIQATARQVAQADSERIAVENFREDFLQLGTSVYRELPVTSPGAETRAVLPSTGVRTQPMNREF
jgi:hypothetical protein